MKTVLIAGGGNFGCWWASSLSADPLISSITLYDPFVNNLPLVFRRAVTISSRDISSHFSYESNLNLLEEFYDLVVIATNSAERFSTFVSLFSRITSSCWVLEKVISYSLDELDAYLEFCSSTTLLVNHSRRMQPLWSKIKAQKSLSLPSTILQRLGPWDLASNCFHFADLVSWLYCSPVKSITINDSSWRNSEKRSAGYHDLSGVIEIVYDCGICHSIKRDESFSENAFEFNLTDSPTPYVCVHEIAGIARFESGYQLYEPYKDWSLLANEFSSGLWQNEVKLPEFTSVYSNTKLILEALREDWRISSGQSISKFKIS